MERIAGEMGAHPKGRLGDRHVYREDIVMGGLRDGRTT